MHGIIKLVIVIVMLFLFIALSQTCWQAENIKGVIELSYTEIDLILILLVLALGIVVILILIENKIIKL